MINFTQGDTPLLTLTATGGNGLGIDLTGATLTTQFKTAGGQMVTADNSQHTADADQVNNKGLFTLQLTAAQTVAIGASIGKDIVTEIVNGGSTIFVHGAGILTVQKNKPSN